MKIGMRLIIGFALLIIALIVVAFVGISKLDTLNDEVTNLADDKFPKTVEANNMIDYVNEASRAISNILLTNDASIAQTEKDRLKDVASKVNKSEKYLLETTKSEEGKALLKAIDDIRMKEYYPLRAKVIELNDAGNKEAAIALLFGDFRSAQNNYIESLHNLNEFQAKLVNESNQDCDEIYSSATTLMFIIAGIAIIIAIIVAFWLITSITKPLAKAVTAANNIADGNLKVDLESNSKDETGILLNAMKTMANSIESLVKTTVMLGNAATEGKLDTRANANDYKGEYKNVVSGINGMMDAIIGPLNIAAEYMDRISKGDIPPKITDVMRGDFNEIKNNLNTCIDAIGALVNDTKMLVKATLDGKLDTREDITKHQGDFRAIVQGINDTLDAVIGPLNIAAEYMDRISKGDIPPKITDVMRGDFNEIKNNLNTCIDALNNLVQSMINTSNEQKAGDIEAFADENAFRGVYNQLIKSFNDGMKIYINVILNILGILEEYAKGDLKKEMPVLPGKQIIATERMNLVRQNVLNLVTDTKMLAMEAAEGKLNVRADASKHGGDFGVIIKGINQTLDNIVEPINEAGSVLSTLANGDLTAKMTGNYKGDINKLKEDINTVSESLGSAMIQILDAVEQAASAALQISSTAGTMAAGAQEQSAQADEVASAVEEMSRTITENAMSASKTSEVADQNGQVAKEGGSVVRQTVQKMRDIASVVKASAENIEKLGESSKQIGEIISVIDDIADQTNLLALNAAIEAARAGEQGRGFAVVADEVRKLAERTTEATKQIAVMIKGIQTETQQAVEAMKQGNHEVNSGISLADQAGKSLEEIVHSSQEVLDSINQIAAANEEQSSTSEQIAKNVGAISQVSNESAKRVQDVAHAADDLTKLTEHLRDLVSQFKVDGGGSTKDSYRSVASIGATSKRHLPPKK